ncbi:MAG: RNA 2',3'-cyclic phosphodiesterase [Candidatus Limnocylindria bacterium]
MTEAADERAWRCFVGVPIDDDLRVALSTCVGAWRTEIDARWTDPAGWHCSLHFIGKLERGRVERVSAAVREAVRGQPRFTTRTGGVSAFPSPARARVLYYGVADPEGALSRLARTVSAAAGDVGGDDVASFRGHVTLARLRRPQRLDEWIASRQPPVGHLDVSEACLMRSHLGPGPARYERVACFRLAA